MLALAIFSSTMVCCVYFSVFPVLPHSVIALSSPLVLCLGSGFHFTIVFSVMGARTSADMRGSWLGRAGQSHVLQLRGWVSGVSPQIPEGLRLQMVLSA